MRKQRAQQRFEGRNGSVRTDKKGVPGGRAGRSERCGEKMVGARMWGQHEPVRDGVRGMGRIGGSSWQRRVELKGRKGRGRHALLANSASVGRSREPSQKRVPSKSELRALKAEADAQEDIRALIDKVAIEMERMPMEDVSSALQDDAQQTARRAVSSAHRAKLENGGNDDVDGDDDDERTTSLSGGRVSLSIDVENSSKDGHPVDGIVTQAFLSTAPTEFRIQKANESSVPGSDSPSGSVAVCAARWACEDEQTLKGSGSG